MLEQGRDIPSQKLPVAPAPWWIRLCRMLWKIIAYLGTAVILGAVASLIATWLTSPQGVIPPNTPLRQLLASWSIVLPVGCCLLLLALFIRVISRWPVQVAAPLSPAQQDRIHMLRRLRMRYEQILTQSLQGVVKLELGLAERSAAVQNAVSLLLRLPDQPEQLLPPHTSIVQAYELAQQELLILGEPGTGKSTLLVELARALVTEAEQDVTRPLPILLPLSSWATHKDPLHKWLAEEIARLYDLSPRLGQQWIAAEQVLPLLDGLDEMEEAARPACIAAINAYHREHVRPLVICSRTSEYEAATRHERLMLHTAAVVQPLECRQVDAYLASLGKPLSGLLATLKTNSLLQELATTPLMLQVLMLTYHGTSIRTLPQQEAQLRQQLWTDYIQRMIERKGDRRRYPLAVTTGWLIWLASMMRQHNQTIFSLKSPESRWLPTRLENRYRWSLGSFAGLFAGLNFGLFVGLGANWFGLVGGLIGGLSAGLLCGLLCGLLASGEFNKLLSDDSFFWRFIALVSGVTGLVSAMIGGLTAKLIGALGAGLVSGLSAVLVNVLVVSGLNAEWLEFTSPAFLGLYIFLAPYLLRFWLARSGLFPWRAVPFLEDATARILLRRVGGGYSFAHRLLLDYFADLDAQPSLARDVAQTNSISVQTTASTSADKS